MSIKILQCIGQNISIPKNPPHSIWICCVHLTLVVPVTWSVAVDEPRNSFLARDWSIVVNAELWLVETVEAYLGDQWPPWPPHPHLSVDWFFNFWTIFRIILSSANIINYDNWILLELPINSIHFIFIYCFILNRTFRDLNAVFKLTQWYISIHVHFFSLNIDWTKILVICFHYIFKEGKAPFLPAIVRKWNDTEIFLHNGPWTTYTRQGDDS